MWGGSQSVSQRANEATELLVRLLPKLSCGSVKCKGSNKSAYTYVIHDPAMVFYADFYIDESE